MAGLQRQICKSGLHNTHMIICSYVQYVQLVPCRVSCDSRFDRSRRKRTGSGAQVGGEGQVEEEELWGRNGRCRWCGAGRVVWGRGRWWGAGAGGQGPVVRVRACRAGEGPVVQMSSLWCMC